MPTNKELIEELRQAKTDYFIFRYYMRSLLGQAADALERWENLGRDIVSDLERPEAEPLSPWKEDLLFKTKKCLGE